MQHVKHKAILFDLDGTLVDTIQDISSALAHVLAKRNLPGLNDEQTKSVVGRGLRNAVKGAFAVHGVQISDTELEPAYEDLMQYYRAHHTDYSHPYPGIVRMLEKLDSSGIPMGIFSNKEDSLTQEVAQRLFPGIHFAWVRGLRDGSPRKPDRSGVDDFCTYVGVENKELVYIGDSEVDYQTAKNAGCPLVMVTWGFRPISTLMGLEGSVLVDTVQALEDAIYGIQ